MAQDYTNDYSSTLNSAYTSGGTSLVVTSATGLPASGATFYLKVDNEYFKCTSYSGTTLTVVGAQQGSGASNHANGAGITGCWWLPAVIDGVRADQSQVGTYANLPASGMKKGDHYKCTDAPYDLIYDGSNWQAFFFGYNVVIPSLTTFSWANQGSATEDHTRGYVRLLSDTAGGTNARVRYVAGPGAHFSIYAAFTISGAPTNWLAGIGLRESSSGKLYFVCWDGFSSGNTVIRYYNGPTNAGGVTSNILAASGNVPVIFFKISYDGTNVTTYVSESGDVSGQYYQVHQVAATTPFTTAPDGGCFFVDNEGLSIAHGFSLVHWNMTTP